MTCPFPHLLERGLIQYPVPAIEKPKQRHIPVAATLALGHRPTRRECKEMNLCIHCCRPAIYYGEQWGYGVKCQSCADAAKRRRTGK